MVSVAEQFGNLRDTLGSILGIFTLMRWIRTAIAKLTGRPLPASSKDLTPASFAAFNGRDERRLSALYSPDWVIVPTNSEIRQGRAGIAEFWTSFAAHATAVSITCESRRELGPGFVQEVGRYSFHMQDNHRTVAGKYLFNCVLDGGEYRIVTHMWNRHLWD